ncbi:MAG: hypothetical protein HDS38_01965 [Bacteroides sp.]|nr:hypothetical protein [Bacteroides sp.]
MKNLQFSIIYAVLRQETSEKISVGMIIVDDSKIDIRYSEGKLKALKYLFPVHDFDFINRAIRALPFNNSISSKRDIEYLSRYSNNLLTVTPLETIDIEPTEENKKWLFDNYVESLVEVS